MPRLFSLNADVRERLLAYVFAGFFCLFFFELLNRAFPYGAMAGDTPGYMNVVAHFRWGAMNAQEWIRTPLTGWMFSVATMFSRPSVAVFWINAFFYIAAVETVLWFARTLFGSTVVAVLFASLFVLLEVLLMHSFLSTLRLIADSTFTSVILIGMLLIIGGWIKGRGLPVYCGYALIGLAAFERPFGAGLFFLLIPAAFLPSRARVKRRWMVHLRHSAICIALLTLPLLLWSARNAFVYGTFEPTAATGRYLLAKVLPLLRDTDRVLPNANDNRTFIEDVRTLQRTVGTDYNSYANGAYHSADNPYNFLYSIDGGINITSPTDRDIFRHGGLSTVVALHIVASHPIGYIGMVAGDYVGLLSQSASYLFPVSVGHYYALWVSHTLPYAAPYFGVFYPPDGRMFMTMSDPRAFDVLYALSRFVHERGMIAWGASLAPVIVPHALFLLALIGYLLARRYRWNARFADGCLAVIFLLFVMMEFDLFAMSLEFADIRYGFPSELLTHVAYLTALFLCIGGLARGWRRVSRSLFAYKTAAPNATARHTTHAPST
ncbi:MAG TPA: hypothetical protein VHA78_06070 [Candidatus Peribacteraceae bacterium]|nr:hypothetical protein [Candidatus Peribacteraceae bacterium]